MKKLLISLVASCLITISLSGCGNSGKSACVKWCEDNDLNCTISSEDDRYVIFDDMLPDGTKVHFELRHPQKKDTEKTHDIECIKRDETAYTDDYVEDAVSTALQPLADKYGTDHNFGFTYFNSDITYSLRLTIPREMDDEQAALVVEEYVDTIRECDVRDRCDKIGIMGRYYHGSTSTDRVYLESNRDY